MSNNLRTPIAAAISEGQRASAISDRLMTTRDAADYLGVSDAWMVRERWKGTGPAYVKVGNRAVRYLKADLAAWIAAKRVGGQHVR